MLRPPTTEHQMITKAERLDQIARLQDIIRADMIQRIDQALLERYNGRDPIDVDFGAVAEPLVEEVAESYRRVGGWVVEVVAADQDPQGRGSFLRFS
jgi:hypothetical protein